MWLLFIVVVMVISVLMVFLIMAIRMLTGQAKDQLNRYFLKNLETYDRLAENKNAQIDDLQRQVSDLEEKIDSAKERLEQRISHEPSGGGTCISRRSRGSTHSFLSGSGIPG